ncbi:MAG: hypothetical protein KAU17_05855, partial [Spirochaetales bacterium]|nr:hypothetical protein [Spirochaetales bacterium]
MVTGSGEARGMGYWAETQVKGLSQCNEAICWSCECKSHHRSSQFGNNTCRGKELAVELLGQRHIHRTKRWIKDGNKTGL